MRFTQRLRVEYVLVLFSGHGGTDAASRRPVLQLNARPQRVWLDGVLPAASRQLVIVDACRSFLGDAGLSGLFGEEKQYFPSNLSRTHARRLFDLTLARSEPGRVVCFACQQGTTSLDTQTGGYFSCELLDTTNEWTVAPSDNEYLSIHGAFERTRHTIARRPNPPQQPYLWDSLPSRRYSFRFSRTGGRTMRLCLGKQPV
ncbi:MAG: hypothetical protein EOO63_00795 [Hymenobacter sp.]|nr:MAG: hypothetical protein EOO63_00795 [Hymenobacter sp.]